jgi:hypothetical protein
MTTRIEATGATHAAAHLGAGLSGSAPNQIGRLGGERVLASSLTQSVLGDAAEEISLLFSEKAEKRRTEDWSPKVSSRPPLMPPEQIKAYLDQAHRDVDPQKLARMVQQLLNDGARNPYALAGSDPSFQQPTEQFLLFQLARSQADTSSLGPEILRRLDDELASLQTLHGDEIHANLLTIRPAAEYAQTRQDLQRYQGALQSVLGTPSLQKAMQEVMALAGSGGQRLDSAIEHLMQGLGACLGSGLAREERLLETVLTDLFHLKALNTALEACRALVMRLRGRASSGRSPQKNGSRLTRETPAHHAAARP